MAAHRYWRIRCPETHSGSLGVAELEMRSSTGGSDLTTGKTAYAFVALGGYPASQAIDNNSATFYTNGGIAPPSSGIGHWLAVDFGSGGAVDIVEVVIQVRPDGFREDPKRMYIDYSDDDVNWYSAWYQNSIAAWTAGETRTFNISGASTLNNRAWRVRSNCGDGAGLAIAKLELHSSIGGSDLASGKTAFASQVTGGYPASNAIDGNASTFWNSDIDIPGRGYQWLGVSGFSTSDVIVEVVVSSRNDGFRTFDPDDLYVDYSDNDLLNWTFAWGVGSIGTWTAGQTRTFDNTSTFGKGWRLRTTSTNDASFTRINIVELQMRSSIGGSDLTLGKPCSGAVYNNPPRQAIDDSTGSYFGNDTTPPFIAADGMWFAAFDLTTGSAQVVEVVYTSRGGWADRTPASFFIESTPDGGLTWASEWSVAGPLTWTSGETKTFSNAALGARRRLMTVCN